MSDGPPAIPDVRVPGVRNREAADAANDLGRAGLIAVRRDESDSFVPAGRAVRTDPAAGTPLASGSKVTLYISSGPDPDPTVPNTTTTSTSVTTTSSTTTTVPSTTPTTKKK
ncbi:MAG: PASTA domain-containing protein [Pseudonocardiaceae bacterium]